MTNDQRPCYWHILAAIPFGLSSLFVHSLMAEKAANLRMINGLIPVHILAAVQIGYLFGLVAFFFLLLFFLSFFFKVLHELHVIKTLSLVSLFLFSFWCFLAAMWVHMIV